MNKEKFFLDNEIQDQLEEREDEEVKSLDQFKDVFETNAFAEKASTEDLKKIYNDYKKAIERRDREPTDEDRFNFHFFGKGSFDETYMFGDDSIGYLLGYEKHGAFIVSHFAPAGLKQGVKLMRKLGNEYHFPAIMFVTKDLADTLKKMPEWKVIDDIEIPQYFAGEIVKKYIAHNNHESVEHVLEELKKEYL